MFRQISGLAPAFFWEHPKDSVCRLRSTSSRASNDYGQTDQSQESEPDDEKLVACR